MKQLLISIVDISSDAIEASVSIGELHQASGNLQTISASVAAATEEFSSTAKTIAANAGQVAQQSAEVSRSLDKTVSIMSAVDERMNNINHINQELGQATHNINELIQMIEKIAEQTNLLALNASIEAARAGEHGRGFAIVADEVRKLSIQTKQATETIRERAETIHGLSINSDRMVKEAVSVVAEGVQAVSEVRATSSELDAAVASIQNATVEQQSASDLLAESVQDVLHQSESNRQNIDRIAGIFDHILEKVELQRKHLAEQDIPAKVLYLSKADHLLWKKKIIDFEFGRIQLNHADISDHTLCRLGKWYYSDGVKSLGHNNLFMAIEAPHKIVHQSAKQAVERRAKINNADISDLRQQLNVASDEVVKGLNLLIHEIETRQSKR